MWLSHNDIKNRQRRFCLNTLFSCLAKVFLHFVQTFMVFGVFLTASLCVIFLLFNIGDGLHLC